MIHTIGDSHCYAGWSDKICHHLGAVLCYSFGKEKLDRCDIRNFNIKDGDTVVFCFGEIDCRCHIHKHIKDKTYKEIIDNIVNDYFDAIELNVIVSKLTLNICVYNVVPPVKKDNVTENAAYPYLGTDEERKDYSLFFNEKLKEKCFQKGYVFFDVYDKYTDENGFLKKELSDGNVHISNGHYISEFRKKMVPIKVPENIPIKVPEKIPENIPIKVPEKIPENIPIKKGYNFIERLHF